MLEPIERAVWVFTVSQPALVLGSTQPFAVVDSSAAADRGIEVVRRRSGGGAVLLLPGESLWVDVVVPRGDARWDDDVARAAEWLGKAWAEALAACGVPEATVHTGAMVHTEWSRLVCFAGVGAGEVVVDGRKAVGISQRRTRAGARFQCVVHRRWPGEELVALLAPPRPSAADLPPVAEVSAAPDELLAALLATL